MPGKPPKADLSSAYGFSGKNKFPCARRMRQHSRFQPQEHFQNKILPRNRKQWRHNILCKSKTARFPRAKKSPCTIGRGKKVLANLLPTLVLTNRFKGSGFTFSTADSSPANAFLLTKFKKAIKNLHVHYAPRKTFSLKNNFREKNGKPVKWISSARCPFHPPAVRQPVSPGPGFAPEAFSCPALNFP